MFNKPFDQITIQDIEELVQTRVERENNHLEYKRELRGSDRDKKEFLKDVSGFANATGGFLIIGVEETDGKPGQICGTSKSVGNQKADEWINNVLISNIDEKVRYEIKVFDLPVDRVVIALYIPESPKKPHMVTYDKRNSYFIRHNTSVNPANQNEVREMFEYSKKAMDKLEDFLKGRNLIDDKNEQFGFNENSVRLTNTRVSEIQGMKFPFILYSFVPRYLDENLLNTISHDFQQWIRENSGNSAPFKHLNLFNVTRRMVTLYGITFQESPAPSRELSESYWSYFEILNNGFFESGICEDLFDVIRPTPERISTILDLTGSVGYSWQLLNFAKRFYNEIGFLDEVLFQISVVNVKNCLLAGFGKKDERSKWAEPFSVGYRNPQPCQHDRFKVLERFIVNELSDESVIKLIRGIAGKLSRAFGEIVVKCFDDDGNFNIDGMTNRFR